MRVDYRIAKKVGSDRGLVSKSPVLDITDPEGLSLAAAFSNRPANAETACGPSELIRVRAPATGAVASLAGQAQRLATGAEQKLSESSRPRMPFA
jgi:hypothetical protein